MALNVLASFLFLFCTVDYVVGREDLRFNLSGTVSFNNSVIPITDIDIEGSSAPLECITDLRPCCRQEPAPQMLMGQWYYPNGSMIQNREISGDFFRTRGVNDGRVNLFRRNSDVVSPFGSYCCEIPDTTGTLRRFCVNLAPSGFSFVINDGEAVPTTGQSYNLTCSVSGGIVSSYQWWKDGAVLQGRTTEMLSFSPLRLSDAGRYTCQVDVTASSKTFTAYQNHSVIIQIPAPTSVSVTSNQPNPIRPIGSTVTLTCTVVLAECVDGLTVNTEWIGSDGFSQNGMAQCMGSTTTYTSTAMVSSFGRDQSGDYTCTATVSSTSSFLTNSSSNSEQERVTVGVYLSHNEVVIESNSTILITDIGTSTPQHLVCTTDKSDCCEGLDGVADWLFPDGGVVPFTSDAETFGRDRSSNGETILYRVNNVMSPTGRFCCRVPDATGTNHTPCVVIISVQLIGSVATPDSVLGGNYSLTCNVSGSDVTTYLWRKDGVDLSETGSTLSFSPLRLSDAGRYTCNVTVNEVMYRVEKDVNLTIPAPESVNVTSLPDTPVRPIGATVTLTCTVELRNNSGAINVPVTVNTVWTGPDGFMTTTTAQRMGSTTTYISTAMVSSFGRDQSGDYNCTAMLIANMISSFITNSISVNVVKRTTVGVYLSHNGSVVEPDSDIFITDIGTSSSDKAVVCTTDRNPCCKNSQHGEWKFPNNSTVTKEPSTTFRRNRDNSGNVILFRVNSSVISPTGRFCCEINDATEINQIVCINVVFISVQVSGNATNQAIAQGYALTCSVVGATVTDYQWVKNGVVLNETGTTLSFPSLTLSDAGRYTCSVTVNQVEYNNTKDIVLAIPAPTSVMTSSNVSSPIQTIESVVTLTCAVTLSETVDIPVTINTEWTGPSGFMDVYNVTTNANLKTYSNSTQINQFDSNNFGNYTCAFTLKSVSESSFIKNHNNDSTVEVTFGVYLVLGDGVIANNSDILLTNIREGDMGALLCFTDRKNCCTNTGDNIGALGTWSFPNGTNVNTIESGSDIYISRGDRVVRLNHRNNSTAPIGQFCCDIRDASSKTRKVCANLGITDIDQTGTQTADTSAAIVAGVVVVVVVVLLIVIIIIVLVFVLIRGRKGKQYTTFSPSSIKYAKATTTIGESLDIDGSSINEPHIKEFPPDTNITEGEGVYFKIKVSGVPQPTVTWYHDGEPVKADYAREVEEDGSLAIPSMELKHSGVYKAVVANQHGSEEREVKLTVVEEGGNSIATAFDEMVTSRPIPISEFGQYVSDLHANSNQPFKDLYQALDNGESGHSVTHAKQLKLKPFNRFANIVVYDDNRVVLEPLSDYSDCQREYINASYVDGYNTPKKFLTTQGPLPKTLVDFWRLIWQERPPTIVMVTNIKEGTRIKCQQYWPDSGKKEIGPFEVTMTDKQEFTDYSVRTLSVSLGSGRSHKVTQYHFTAWPDHGVPDYATPILAFHKRVKAQHHPSRGPMVVHCSAGVGRTGTFIVIDNILEQIEKEQVVDIPGAVTKIRQKRMKMVQTHEQFTFIHDAILESVTCGDTQIAATNLRVSIAKMKKTNNNTHINGFEQQFKVLEQVSPNPDELQCSSARSYPDKNKGDKFLPADKWRVILTGEQPDYINAVNINGYKRKKAFIIAQSPMKNTVRNFWKIIYDRKCAVIVMLSDLVEEGQEASAQYWPNSGMTPYEEYTVDLLGEEKLEGFTIREISVLEAKAKKAHKVTQFHITCWTADGRCSNLRSITDVIEEMTKVQIRSGNKPIVVHCNDTVTRSGMFCAIATTIERCKTEGVVDVFQVVKALRVQKPGAVPTVDNFKQLFDTILVYLESFDTYANFQNI